MNRSIKKFEDLIVWQESMKLTKDIYSLLRTCKDFGLKDQMQRSAVSVPSNIAEGYERKYNKEFIRFLNIAKGSNGELRTQLHISISIGLVDAKVGKQYIKQTHRISAMLFGLIEKRRRDF